MKRKLTVYQRLVNAELGGKGLYLSADEVWELCRDDAIAQRAEKDDENDRGTPDSDLY